MKPFLMESLDQFRSSGPNTLTSDKYAKEYNEVKELSSLTSTRRTADQTTAAIFWQFPPTALWNGMARDLNGGARCRCRRRSSPARHAEPRWRGRCHRLLERQELLELLAAHHGDPRGRL
jgi:hypothetical protein